MPQAVRALRELPVAAVGAPGRVLRLPAPAKGRVVLLCVQFPAVLSCDQSLHRAR